MILSKILRPISRLLFPEHCLGCRQRGAYLCSACISQLWPAEDIEDLPALAAYDYHDPRIKQAIWLLKYRGITSLGPLFARLLYDRLLELLADEQAVLPGLAPRWLLIPTPLSAARQRERGYNQAAVIARALARLAPEHLSLTENLLIKTRHTPTQVSIKNRHDRLANLRGAFTVTRPELVRGQKIILLDDVITTGATVREATRVLRAAGAKTVLAIAVAHG